MHSKIINMKKYIIIFVIFISSNLTAQTNSSKIQFLDKWYKLKNQDKIILMNDYIIDFALFRNLNYQKIDSNCFRSSNKKYFDNSERDSVLFHFINIFLMNNDTLKKIDSCCYSFIIHIINLSSYDQQKQLFDNYIKRAYLDEQIKARKILRKDQIEKLTEIVSFFINKKDKIYYQKQIKLLYKMDVKINEEINQKMVDCFCK